ncbi:MAG: 16S rRNA (cytidine(1402)-2'-O)-methyltransferase [Rhodoluna sp.]|nr:16S rRNA (cytidine(1402)-2'-O)-methyltransferase [Rhodoluna sp.]
MIILAATPIGNLGDASPRLIEAITTLPYIAAEDTRTLLNLVHALGVRHEAKLFSLHEHNESERLTQLVELAKTADVLVVSDAGMPTVSDPGFLLVRAAVEAGVEVTVIPGPSAVLAAIAVSGLPTDRFTFEGFLPRKSGDRRKAFTALAEEQRTMVFFESPHRIKEALEDASAIFGADRLATVSRELTKKFEHPERATLGELIEWAKTDPKGEMVIVIAGAQPKVVTIESLVEEVLADKTNGLKQAVAMVAERHSVSKSALYQAALEARALR